MRARRYAWRNAAGIRWRWSGGRMNHRTARDAEQRPLTSGRRRRPVLLGRRLRRWRRLRAQTRAAGAEGSRAEQGETRSGAACLKQLRELGGRRHGRHGLLGRRVRGRGHDGWLLLGRSVCGVRPTHHIRRRQRVSARACAHLRRQREVRNIGRFVAEPEEETHLPPERMKCASVPCKRSTIARARRCRETRRPRG
jgi:hypothetical protein